ncbi:hypothetical protein K0817_008375 [Microbacterium sp. HD4P20]|uniref:hypothetical protein n=1 Tax=Microbacterium sp. HD4P20 TaxID=2864874 RepID=UPI001C63B971|nr:hypothetical protein [Microbacterium sp. HD4P20]MCP2636583.1 hypothetical protein [Microbacterium sp. HD4P20]
MRLPFWARPRTRIDLCFNAALQPVHRGYCFADPIEAVLKRVAPGSRLTDEGSVLDERAEVIRSDVSVEVTGDAATVLSELTRFLESSYHVPRGSYAMLAGERHDFGTAEGVALRLSPALPIDAMYDDVPSHVTFVDSLGRIHDLLRGNGAVLSWMLRETRTSAYLYGRSAPTMTEIGLAVLRRDFPNTTITADIIA